MSDDVIHMSDDVLMTIGDLAVKLQLTNNGIYQLRYRGEGPPAVRIGGRVRFRSCDVENWIQSQVESDR